MMTMAEEANSSRKPLTASESESHAYACSRGHEERIVQPSSYLRPRGFSLPPMPPVQPQKFIDREERQGLVCSAHFSLFPLSSLSHVLVLLFLCPAWLGPRHLRTNPPVNACPAALRLSFFLFYFFRFTRFTRFPSGVSM